MSAAEFDAAVIGGGPAGCSAAITLAQRGARVVLFEAGTYPHHKVCGEFLSPECLYFLDRLDALAPLRALGPVPITTACLTGRGAAWETRLPGTAWGISRAALDAVLADRARAAGVEVRAGTAITGIAGSLERGFTLAARGAGSAAARVVIGAYGKRSSLDRTLGRSFLRRPQPFIGLKAHFHGPPLPGRIELHTFPGGYCGMSEIEGGAANVCLLVREAVFQAARGAGEEGIEGFLRWMRSQNPRLGTWLAEAERISPRWLSIAQVPFVAKTALAGDVLMAGDSAGLIAPLAGDGIAMALHGGQMAAQAAADFLAGELAAPALRRRYAEDWRCAFQARLRLGRVLQAILFRPHLAVPVLRLVAAVPPLGDVLVRQTRDTRLIGRAEIIMEQPPSPEPRSDRVLM